MQYLLLAFTKQQEQEKFVNRLADDISAIATSETVNFYFGPEAIIYTFSSSDDLEYVKSYFDAILGGLWIPFILTPYQPDKMTYWFEKEVENHLFGTNNCVQEDDLTKEEKEEVQKLMFKGLDESLENALNNDDDSVDEFLQTLLDSDKRKTKKSKVIPTLDDLLDKINKTGINSLTQEEKNLLKKYSN